MTENRSSALARIEERFPVLAGEVEQTIHALRENFGDEQISPFILPKVTVPSGKGAKVWSLESPLNPDGETIRELEGIIIGHQPVRKFYRQSIEQGGGNNPPDCFSPDGRVGFGDPGGECAACPFSKIGGSSDDERSCAERRIVLLLRPDELLPTLIDIPPTSSKNAKAFLFGLASRRIPFYGATVKLSLIPARNAGGIEYFRIGFALGELLTDEARANAEGYSKAIAPLLRVTARNAATGSAERPATDDDF